MGCNIKVDYILVSIISELKDSLKIPNVWFDFNNLFIDNRWKYLYIRNKMISEA